MKEYRDNRGFTLVEVLVALAILAIGIMGVTVMVPRALEQGRKSVALTRSANQAESTFSQYRAKGFRSMYGTPGDKSTLAGVAGENIAKTAEIYRTYGWQDNPLVQSKMKFTQLQLPARSAGLYKMTVSVPLVGGGRSSYVTYLARE